MVLQSFLQRLKQRNYMNPSDYNADITQRGNANQGNVFLDDVTSDLIEATKQYAARKGLDTYGPFDIGGTGAGSFNVVLTKATV